MIKRAMKIIDRIKTLGYSNDYLKLALTLIIIIGALIYYLYALNWLGILVTLITSGVAFFVLKKSIIKNKNANIKLVLDKKFYYLIGGYLLSWGFAFWLLWSNQSGRALISPWEVIPSSFFLIYALSTLILISILVKKKVSPGIKIALLSGQYLLTTLVAAIVYKLGYGFDPFVHQATMELIAEKGVVFPKPPYYLGEYSLIIILHKLSGLSIYFLNKILVPVLSSLFLPLAFYRFLKAEFVLKNNSTDYQATAAIFLTIIFLPILTFSPFIATTPQNLSYLFLILAVLAGFSRQNLTTVWLLSLATVAIHPLTGLPALGLSAWLTFQEHQASLKIRARKIVKIIILAGTALALPLTLFLTGGRNLSNNGWIGLKELIGNFFINCGSVGRETWLLNFIYFFAHNYQLILVILIALALILFYRRYQKWFLIISALLVAFILSSQIRFNDLINYEQASYATRILVIIVIFCLPGLVLLSYKLIAKIYTAEKKLQILWLIFGLGLLLSSLYLSYPRFDKYWHSRGYATSLNDQKAVQLIDAQETEPYLVLANQPVSAAALNAFGFNHYFTTPDGPLYFYPIPTGGPLYQYYLEMVYKNPSHLVMNKALDLAGVKVGYLIVNKYWYQSGQVINAAKLTADSWQEVNKEIYIFKYKY